ncbi:MAG: hypothetical protein WC593_06600 [Methanoregula sp.]
MAGRLNPVNGKTGVAKPLIPLSGIKASPPPGHDPTEHKKAETRKAANQ